jgi:type II secretory pathway pseudopilin PulG
MVAPRRGQRAFTYLAILFAVAIGSIALCGVLTTWSLQERRDKEAALLFAGGQLRAAIASYYELSPGPDKQYPDSLAVLLLDRRVVPARRHLRQLYPDPMSNNGKWTLLRTAGGALMGVASSASGSPLKRANFGPLDQGLIGKTAYADWKFVYDKGLDRHLPAVFMQQP